MHLQCLCEAAVTPKTPFGKSYGFTFIFLRLSTAILSSLNNVINVIVLVCTVFGKALGAFRHFIFKLRKVRNMVTVNTDVVR